MTATSADPPAPSRDSSGWSGLFWEAFKRSRNAMVLLDGHRRHVEVNAPYLQMLGRKRASLIGQPVYELVAGGPIVSNREWRALLRRRQFTGIAELMRDDGGRVRVEFAGHPETVTGRHLVLFVALKTARGIRRLNHDVAQRPAPAGLSSREREVVELTALGLTGPEIAEELHISRNTVRTHIRNAMEKLGARSRAQLVAKAMADGVCWDSS